MSYVGKIDRVKFSNCKKMRPGQIYVRFYKATWQIINWSGAIIQVLLLLYHPNFLYMQQIFIELLLVPSLVPQT